MERLEILITPEDKRKLRIVAAILDLSMGEIVRLGGMAIVDAFLSVKTATIKRAEQEREVG